MARAEIKATAKTTKYPDGRQDVTINVPMLQLKEQVNGETWEAIKSHLCDRKYAELKAACESNGDDGAREWAEFKDAVVNRKYQIRAKQMADAKARAYRIAEKYGFALNIIEA